MSYLEEVLPEFRKGAKIRLKGWAKGQYLRYDVRDKNVVNDQGEYVDIMGSHLSSNNWEFYQEPETDWDCIIKNKCLCWFWDEGESETGKTAGELIEIRKNSSLPFIKGTTDKGYSIGYSHCCPVRKDEITFYEDGK